MTPKIDLGHSLLRDSSSSLQLHFRGTATFTQTDGRNDSSSLDFEQWEDLPSLWITEAPEMELCLVVGGDPEIKLACSRFITELEEIICRSKVWTSLRFNIILKSCPSFGSPIASTSESPRVVFGLCRRSVPPDTSRSRIVPPALRDPPDICAPSDIPNACLSSIDLDLHYASCDTARQAQDPIRETLHQQNDTNLPQASCSTHIFSSARNYPATPFAVQPFDGIESSNIDSEMLSQKYGNGQLLTQMIDLFEFGLHTLILPIVTRPRHIKLIGKDRLQNLSMLAPAIFDPEYREAMKHRAASLTTISRSLVSMLESSNNPALQQKLSALVMNSNDRPQSVTCDNRRRSPHSARLTAGLRSNLESSLWSIAQHKLFRGKPAKRSFFEFTRTPKLLSSLSSRPEDDVIIPPSSEHEADLESEILRLDGDKEPSPDLEPSQAFDGLLSDGSSMLSFKDFNELTQTTELTQIGRTSHENSSQATGYVSHAWDEIEILLSEDISLDESLNEEEILQGLDPF